MSLWKVIIKQLKTSKMAIEPWLPRMNSWSLYRFHRTFSTILSLLTIIWLVFEGRYLATVVIYRLKTIVCSLLAKEIYNIIEIEWLWFVEYTQLWNNPLIKIIRKLTKLEILVLQRDLCSRHWSTCMSHFYITSL